MFRNTKENWELMSRGKRRLVVGSVVLIVLMIAALIWSILRNLNAEPVTYEPIQEVEEEPDSLEALAPNAAILPAPRSLDRTVLERHFAAIGGVKRLTSINSLLVLGDVTLPDGEVMSFVIAKKHGERIRISNTKPKSTVVMVSTPEDAWRSVRIDGKLMTVEDLPDKEVQNLRKSSYVVSELFLAMNNSWSVEYLGQQAFNYQMAHCFEVKLNQGHFIRFYIDPETYLDIGREERAFEEDGTLKVSRSLTSDHMDISGMTVPAKTETYVDGELIQTFVVTDVEVNPGILESSFVRPELPVAAEE